MTSDAGPLPVLIVRLYYYCFGVLWCPLWDRERGVPLTWVSLARTLRGFGQLAYMPLLYPVCEREDGGSDGPGDTCTLPGVYDGGRSPNRHSADRRH